MTGPPGTVVLIAAWFQVPVIKLSDVVGSTGAAPPTQIVVGTVAKTGVTLDAIVMLSVTGATQEPADGVNVYGVGGPATDVFTVAGFQVPVIKLSDVVGSTGAGPPTQIAVGIEAKVGVTLAAIVMLSVTGAAQEPADGVNV